MTSFLLLLPLSPMELVVILVVVVLLFGASRIPQLGRAVGEGIRNFKEGIRDGASTDSKGDGGPRGTGPSGG